ncbi:MAG: ribulose bisphosphate carboxylase small subunit [Rhodomicrobium sp.]|nr:ribulose bisphosphate carboxylase small subunit [Rhodomicrobium sp.]
MRITQGTFSFLPDLTDDQIKRQVQYCIEKGWAVNIEFTDDPHPRNTYWEMWGLPMFDIKDASAVMMELGECRKIYGELSFIVNRPKDEPGFDLQRQETEGRNLRYTTRPYAADKPAGRRYS